MRERKLFVVTGGPGAGKSTLIAALTASGQASAPEAGRGIIQAQRAIGGPALPWREPALFAEMMLSWDIRSYEEASAGITFMDRGVPDTLGYLNLIGHPVPAHMEHAARRYRYEQTVFILPPWREIYAQDIERKQDFGEADATFQCLRAVYAELGYDLVEVPKADVDERAAFVLDRIA